MATYKVYSFPRTSKLKNSIFLFIFIQKCDHDTSGKLSTRLVKNDGSTEKSSWINSGVTRGAAGRSPARIHIGKQPEGDGRAGKLLQNPEAKFSKYYLLKY